MTSKIMGLDIASGSQGITRSARAMFDRQKTRLSVELKWEDLGPRAKQGYLDDAMVALEAFFG